MLGACRSGAEIPLQWGYWIRDIQESTGGEIRKHPASRIQDHVIFPKTFIKHPNPDKPELKIEY